jgi:hypothetical protein
MGNDRDLPLPIGDGGEGVRKLQNQTPSSEPPHPVLTFAATVPFKDEGAETD